MNSRKILWKPSAKRKNSSSMKCFMDWLRDERDLSFADFNDLWEWSVNDLERFWKSIWDYFGLRSSTTFSKVLDEEKMPGALWFKGATVNIVYEIFKDYEEIKNNTAISFRSETLGDGVLTWEELISKTNSLVIKFKELGVQKGDRVVAILPNTPHSLISFCATASIGAIWSLCAPDMGENAILDRFKQIKPKVLICQDSYVYAGKIINKVSTLRNIIKKLPSLSATILVKIKDNPLTKKQLEWNNIMRLRGETEIEMLPFDHPLWIVYSSGTTGNPKPIVHGHGGILIEMTKQSLHMDITKNDHFCWLTSSGWIMWNVQLLALLRKCSIAMFDFAPNYPDFLEVWRKVDEEKLTYFGAGAAFFTACMKSNIVPKNKFNFDKLRSLGATGSPLSQEGYNWIYQKVKSDIWLAPLSGGTDFAGAFVIGNPLLDVKEGEMQSKSLGCAVYAFDDNGNSVVGEVGELVCTKPLPSMPLYFWGDKQNKRLTESYFETFPGVWKHGDWIEFTDYGGSVIYGRSDATINRRGLRLGSSEIYRAVESLSEVMDSIVVDLEYLNRESNMTLFVVLCPEIELSDKVREKISGAIKNSISARFVPDKIIKINEVPRTLSGKKLEVPIKKLLLGSDPKTVVNRESMANPSSFEFFVTYAKNQTTKV